MAAFVGIIPAAGTGSRLRPSRYPKELLPIEFRWDDDLGGLVPTLAIEHSLRLMKNAEVQSCTIVTSDTKPEVLRYLGSGSRLGVRIAYTVQEEARGLASAVGQACELMPSDARFCLALPDTITEPETAMRSLTVVVNRGADLVLGVFPTDTPNELGPVDVGPNGRVKRVLDKPPQTTLGNTWSIASWAPRFTEFLLRQLRNGECGEAILGEVFDRACLEGLDVRAVEFQQGSSPDIGTHAGLARVLWERRHEGHSAGRIQPNEPPTSHESPAEAAAMTRGPGAKDGPRRLETVSNNATDVAKPGPARRPASRRRHLETP